MQVIHFTEGATDPINGCTCDSTAQRADPEQQAQGH